MAVMEAALGSSLSHPNILQVGNCCNTLRLLLGTAGILDIYICGQALLLHLGAVG
jgi:hypothetical protein